MDRLLTFLSTLLLALPVTAKPYLSLRTGTAHWHDTSNSNPLETGTEVGSLATLAAGDELGLSDVGLPKSNFALDAEVELGWRHHQLHGRNHGDERRSADGHVFNALTVGANLWPGWQLTRRWTVYAGGGGGLLWARALNDWERSPYWQLGGGVRWNATPALSFDLGARALWACSARFSGYTATYDAVPSAVGGVRWEFSK